MPSDLSSTTQSRASKPGLLCERAQINGLEQANFAFQLAFHFTLPDKDGLIIFAVNFRELILIWRLHLEAYGKVYFPCLYAVDRVEVWQNKKLSWKHEPREKYGKIMFFFRFFFNAPPSVLAAPSPLHPASRQ